MNACWNCEQSRPEDNAYCSTCGWPLRPNANSAQSLQQAIDYLQREVARWDWLDEAKRIELLEHYQERRARLATMDHWRQPLQRLAAPPPPPPVDAPQPAATREWHDVAASAQTAAPAGPGVLDSLQGFLEEKNIRWFQILGGLLLLAGLIGLARMQWGLFGRWLVLLGMLAAPAVAFWGAWALRASLPISSRLLSVVGGLILPVSLLSVHALIPLDAVISKNAWAVLCLGLSGLVLLAISQVLAERACLYLATLSFALAAVALQHAAHDAHALFGMTMVAGGFVYFAVSHAATPPKTLGVAVPMAADFATLSQILVAVGLLSTLPDAVHPGIDAVALFFMGAAFFALVGYILEEPQALYVSALVSVGLAAYYVGSAALAPIHAAFVFLAVGSVYLAQGRRQDPDSAMATASFQVGTWMVGAALIFLFGLDLIRGIVDGFARLPRESVATTALVALAAAVYYGCAAAAYRSPRLVYGVAASLAYAEFMAVVWLQHGSPAWLAAGLAAFPLASLLVGRALRGYLPAAFLEPALEVAIALAILPGPLALIQWALGIEGATRLTPWSTGLLTLFYMLFAVWQRRPAMLYLAVTWGVVSYATTLEPSLARYGLAMLPLAVVLAFASLSVDRAAGREFAMPLARSAFALAVAVILLQPSLWVSGAHGGVALTLILAGAALGAFAAPFHAWLMQGQPASLALAGLSALVLPGGVYAALLTSSRAADALPIMLVLVAAMLGWGRLLAGGGELARAWWRALRAAALAWSAALVFAPSADLADPMRLVVTATPAVLWLIDAILEGWAPGGVTSFALLCVGWLPSHDPFSMPLVRAVLLCGFTAGYLRLLAAGDGFVVGAWLSALYGWFCILYGAHVPDRHFGFGLMPFNLFMALAYGRWPLRHLERLTCVTAGLAVWFTVLEKADWATPLAFAIYAVAFGVVAWRRGSVPYTWASTLVAVWAWLQWSYNAALPLDTCALGFAILAVAWLGIATGLGSAAVPPRIPPDVLQIFTHQATLLAMVGGLLGLETTNAVPTLVAVAALAMQAAVARRSIYLHGAYVLAHLLLLRHLPTGFAVEWVTVPLALWILLWSVLGAAEQRTGMEQLGTGLLLLPSLLLSAGEPHGVHAGVAFGAGLGMLLYGAGRSRPVPRLGGGLGMLGEAMVQVHYVLMPMGSAIYLTVVGVAVIALGVLFERRRREVLALARQLAGTPQVPPPPVP